MSILIFIAIASLLPFTPQIERDNILQGDQRLDRLIAVRIEGLAVDDVLELLTRKTGIRLSASRYTANDKLVAFSPARPLRCLLLDLAALFNDRWERNEARGGVEYRLTRDARARAYEDRLERTASERLMAGLELQARALQETREQLVRRSEDDPIRERLSDPIGRLATEFYALLPRPTKEQLCTSGRLNVPYPALSPRQQSLLHQAIAADLRAKWDGQPEDPGNETVDHAIDRNSAELKRLGARFRLAHPGTGRTHVTVRLGSTAEAFLAALTEDQDPPIPSRGSPYDGGSEAEETSVPEIGAVRAAEAQSSWLDGIRVLAEQSRMPILADYYRSRRHYQVRRREAKANGESSAVALDAFCGREDYRWWTTGGTLLLRKRDWYSQRRYETPDRWILSVAENINRNNGAPTFNDLFRFSELTLKQIHGLMRGHASGESQLILSLTDDEHYLSGLQELLQVLRRSFHPESSESLPNWRQAVTTDRARGERERAQLRWGALTPMQRRMIPGFLVALDEPPAPSPVESFAVEISATKPEESDTGWRFVRTSIAWRYGASGGSYTLLLPASLQDDRRPRTHIEVF